MQLLKEKGFSMNDTYRMEPLAVGLVVTPSQYTNYNVNNF